MTFFNYQIPQYLNRVIVFLVIPLIFSISYLSLFHTSKPPIMASSQAGKAHQSLNIFKKPLALFSKQPMTGFYRNGYCAVGSDDTGNHSVAVTLTDPFLDFTASRGNNLRSIGLTAGCKWCLCAGRWKEAVDHANSKVEAGDGAKTTVVPKVHLHATNEKALDVVSLGDLKKYAAEPEVGNAK